MVGDGLGVGVGVRVGVEVGVEVGVGFSVVKVAFGSGTDESGWLLHPARWMRGKNDNIQSFLNKAEQ